MKMISPTLSRLHVRMGEDAIVLALTIMLTLGITGVSMVLSGHENEITLHPGEIAMYEIDGTSWSVIYFSVNSNHPVTVCITKGNGEGMIKAGSGMCLFLEEHVTHLSKVWRFPVDGPLYLLVIPEGERTPVSVHVEIRSLMSTW